MWNILFHPRRSSCKLESMLAHLFWEHKLFPQCEVKLRRRIINRARRSFIANKDILSPDQKKRIDDFFAPFLNGRKIPYCSHEFYTEKTGVFSEKYIPDDLYYFCIDRYYNDWRMAKTLDNKCLLVKLFPEISLPEHVVYRLGNHWLSPHNRRISKEDAYQMIMNAGSVILKAAVGTSGGKGIKFYDSSRHSVEQLDDIITQFQSDIAIQKVVKQSATLARIHPASLNTVRLLTFLKADGGVKVCSAVLRMGRGSSKVDNASSGGIVAGISPDGRLKNCAYTMHGEKFVYEHPDTHVPFHDIVIPQYANLLALVSKMHQSFTLFRLLSWDMAYDENDKPLMIEVNMSYGQLDFHQLTNGPVFGDDTEAILHEVFSHFK